MAAQTIIDMMQEDDYQALTCKEFALIVKRSKILEVEPIKLSMDDLNISEARKELEPFPSFADDAIERHEGKMKLQENKEFYADFSDQKKGE